MRTDAFDRFWSWLRHQRQAAAVLLMAHVGAHQRTDAGRVNVGNLREVEDESGSGAGAHQRLKLEEVGEQDGTAQTQNSLSCRRPADVFDICKGSCGIRR